MPTQFCTTHKDRETLRICGRCERPFCPDCLIATPVGGRCRECARGPKIARMRVQAWRWPLVAAAALLCGVAAGLVFRVTGWFLIIIAVAAGQLIAGLVLPVSGRKPGLALAVVSTMFLVVGVLGSGAVEGAFGALRDAAEYGPLATAVIDGIRNSALTPWTWIGAALMAGSAFTRLR